MVSYRWRYVVHGPCRRGRSVSRPLAMAGFKAYGALSALVERPVSLICVISIPSIYWHDQRHNIYKNLSIVVLSDAPLVSRLQVSITTWPRKFKVDWVSRHE